MFRKKVKGIHLLSIFKRKKDVFEASKGKMFKTSNIHYFWTHHRIIDDIDITSFAKHPGSISGMTRHSINGHHSRVRKLNF